MTQILTSPLNPRFRSYKSLLNSKGLKESGNCLVMGRKIVPEFLQNPNVHIIEEIRTVEMPQQSAARQALMAPELFQKIDVFGTEHPILLVEQPAVEEIQLHEDPQGVELILPLGNPLNLGAAIRTAAAFGVEKIILTEESSHPFLPQAIRSSSGMCFRIPIATTKLSVHRAQFAGPCFALDVDGEPITKTQWPKSFRMFVGEEGLGLPKHLDLHKIRIPIESTVESLNATVAVAIALYECMRCRSKE